MFLMYFKPTQLHRLQIIGNPVCWIKTLSPGISKNVLQDLEKINCKPPNLREEWIGIQNKKAGEMQVAYFRKVSDLGQG